MRRLKGLLVVAAAGSIAGCGTLPDPHATLADIRGAWRAEPLSLAPATVAAAEAACGEDQPAGGPDGGAATRPAAVDARGTSRITVIFAGAGSAFVRCELLVDSRGELTTAGGWAQTGTGPELLLEQDDITIETSGGMLGGEGLASNASGRVGLAISAVRFVFSDGTVVHASVGGGWFTAWWPTDNMDFVAEAYDSSGRKLAEVER